MDALLASLFAFPTAIFSVALGIAILYWLLVIAGMLDLDLLSFADHDAGHDPAAGHNANVVLEFLRIGQVPLTIIASIFVTAAWVVSLAASTFVRPLVPGWSWWIFGLAALAAAIAVGAFATGLATAPLARIFAVKGNFSAGDLIGSMVEVTSSTVEPRYGTARHDRPSGEDIIINVGCDPVHVFKRGDKAVVMDYDRATGVYRIAPLPHTRPGFLDGEAEPVPPTPRIPQ